MCHILILLSVTGVAAYCDAREKKIPNWLTFSGMAVGFLFSHSMYEAARKAAGILFLFAFGTFRLMGFGDLKLWMCISCLLGFGDSCIIILGGELFLIGHALMERTGRRVLWISVRDVIMTGRVRIFEQQGYAFAPYVVLSALLYSTYEIGVILLC